MTQTKTVFQQIIEKEIGLIVQAEYKFHDVRKWRFDYAIVSKKIAIEVEGGAFTNGRHTRGKGFINDMEKYNEATATGWAVLRFTPTQLLDLKTIEKIRQTVNYRNGNA